MAEKIDIITRNFFRMMRSGALNEYVEIEPMSAFKWKRLADTVVFQDVASVASRAVKNHQFEPNFNMPQTIRELIHESAAQNEGQNIRSEMFNSRLNKKLKRIQALEMHSDGMSRESLGALGIIIANCHAILSGGTSTRLIIRLGNYIRINADKIDYEKVNRWLKDLRMESVARLVGSVLISNFAFKKEELPFVRRVDTKVAAKMTREIMSGGKQKRHRGLGYFSYAPMENTSMILRNMKKRLDAIEE